MTTFLAIRAFLGKMPWWGYAILAIALAIGFAYRAGYNARDERADREMAEMLASVAEGQEQARAAQQAAMDREQARYDELAERMNNAHETTRVVVRDATDSHILARGVQDGQCVPSGTSATPQSDGASVPATVPAYVVVDTPDVRACGDLYAYALASHLWAMGLAEEE